MSGAWRNYYADAQYDAGSWFVVDCDTGERYVDPFCGNINTLVSDENREWCQKTPKKWLHEKFGDGRVHAIKRVQGAHGSFLKVWIGSPEGSQGHLRYQTRFCYVVHYHLIE